MDLPPSNEQELVEMHSPVRPVAATVHVLLEFDGPGLGGSCGVEVQHYEKSVTSS